MKATRPKTSRVRDPRAARGFRPEFYPKADGRAAPPANATGREDRIRLRFLAVYYALNRGYAALLAARASGAVKSPLHQNRETAALKKIEKLLRLRDALEDGFVPLGIDAEPVMKKGLTVNLKFTFGRRPPGPDDPRIPAFSSAYLVIPLPPGVRQG